MKYQVRLTEKAEADVEAVLAWHAEQRTLAAGDRWFVRLMAAIDTLESMPARCPLAAEAQDIGLEIRELLVGKRRGVFRVLFQLQERTVFVVRVWHGARDHLSREDL